MQFLLLLLFGISRGNIFHLLIVCQEIFFEWLNDLVVLVFFLFLSIDLHHFTANCFSFLWFRFCSFCADTFSGGGICLLTLPLESYQVGGPSAFAGGRVGGLVSLCGLLSFCLQSFALIFIY